MEDRFDELTVVNPSCSFSVKKMTVEGHQFRAQIWDTAGQERYFSLSPIYYRDAAAAVVVYDIADEASFEAARRWVGELRKHSARTFVALAGNKSDLVEAGTRQVEAERAAAYVEEIGALFVEVSAKTGENVTALFEAICTRIPGAIATAGDRGHVKMLIASSGRPGSIGCC